MSTKEMTRAQAFAALRELKVVKVEMEFSGGNDEGGVTSMDFYHEPADVSMQNLVEKIDPDKAYEDGNPLVEALVKPVYDQYSSFSGDFYVEGTITWRVEDEKVIQEGYETVPSESTIDSEL